MSLRTSSAAEIVTDDRGHTTRFEHAPMRIVSLVPSLTETLCDVGACARLVGTDRYSNWPDAVAKLPKLGGIEDASLEGVVALRPDLVLAARSARVVERLDELGIPVVALETDTFADVQRAFRLVARIVGTPQEGEAAWRRIQMHIAAATTRMPAAWRGRRVFFQVSDAPHAASPASFIGELLAQLGLGNVVSADLGPYPELSPEFIVRAQPDVILAATAELDGMASRPGWNSLTALRAGRRCGFAPPVFDVLMRPGPRLGEAADAIVSCLHGLAPVEAR